MSLGDLDGICALQGPGSFTGLRVGLATALGFHQALGVRATAIPTLTVLGAGSGASRVLAVVDALRGHWFHQRFSIVGSGQPQSRSDAACHEASRLVFEDIDEVVGFGAQRLAGVAPASIALTEPVALAAGAAMFAARADSWEPRLLTAPLYLRPPPARRTAPATGPDS